MKLLQIVFFVSLLICYGLANADGITISNFDGAWDNDTKVTTGRPVTWTFHFNTQANGLLGFTNGFKVYISDQSDGSNVLNPGPGFTPVSYQILYNFYECATHSAQTLGSDGIGADTIYFGGLDCGGFSASDRISDRGIYIDEDVWSISTQVNSNATGNYLCLDSCFVPPGGAWLWTDDHGANFYPPWDGPHCYLIEPCCQQRGDVVGSPLVLVDDLTLLANYIFKSGSPPDCLDAGDVIIDDLILVNDLVFLVNYIFKGGDAPPPCD